MLLATLLFAASCFDGKGPDNGNKSPQKTQTAQETTSSRSAQPETTGDSPPPEVTLGDDKSEGSEVVIRLEGDPRTTFSGLCSVGEEQNVLSGMVPKRFAFDLKGRELSCRIEKRDGGSGDLKVVLVAGDATRSVQQTNSPGGVIKVSYRG